MMVDGNVIKILKFCTSILPSKGVLCLVAIESIGKVMDAWWLLFLTTSVFLLLTIGVVLVKRSCSAGSSHNQAVHPLPKHAEIGLIYNYVA